MSSSIRARDGMSARPNRRQRAKRWTIAAVVMAFILPAMPSRVYAESAPVARG